MPKHEFVLMYPTLIYYHANHTSLFPLLMCNPSLQQLEIRFPQTTMYLLKWSVILYMHSDCSTVNPYLCGGKRFYQLG